MSSIPENARGYRDGYRAIVRLLLGAAREFDHFGTTQTLNALASQIGKQGKERFAKILNDPDWNTKPSSATPISQIHVNSNEYKKFVPTLLTSASTEALIKKLIQDRHSHYNYVIGCSAGAIDGINAIIRRSEELDDLITRVNLLKFAVYLILQLRKLGVS